MAMFTEFKFPPKLIYLASPYTHSNPRIMRTRAVKISKLAMKLFINGIHVLCPISSSYMMAKYGHYANHKWEAWADLDLNYLSRCDEIWIAMLDDEWMNSVGMRAEYYFAKENNIPVRFVTKRGRLLKETDWNTLAGVKA